MLKKWADIGRLDELSQMDSSVRRLDARAKILVTIVFVVMVMSVPRDNISALIPFFLYPGLMIALGHLSLKTLLKKMIFVAPFALAVGVLNPILDHQKVLLFGTYAVSRGWISLFSIFIRFLLTVSAALVLIASTGIYELCAGLNKLRLPRVFVTQLLFLYRYLFVIVDQAGRLLRSFKLRAVSGHSIPMTVYISMMGHLLLRSMRRAQSVYQAMLVRGFDGEIKILKPLVWRWQDSVFLLGGVSFFIFVHFWNLADLIGQWFLGGLS